MHQNKIRIFVISSKYRYEYSFIIPDEYGIDVDINFENKYEWDTAKPFWYMHHYQSYIPTGNLPS